MTLSSRDILETWMSAFMDGELDYESSTALLEALHGDADLRQEMLQFVSRHQKIQRALQETRPTLSDQEQSDLMVRFWEAIEQEAQETHQQDFLQERAYLLAQNVLQGRLDQEALAKISEKDPQCVQEAAKIIGQMESMRDSLTLSATQEPLDELRKATMNQLFGTAETALEEEENEAQDISESMIEERVDAEEDNITLVPPVPEQEIEVANDNEILDDDDDFVLQTPGAKVIQLFGRVKIPAAITAIAAAIGFFILPTTDEAASPSQEVALAASDLILSESSEIEADPYFEDRVVAAWQMELAKAGEAPAEDLPILKDNSNTEIKSLDVGSRNPMVFSTPNKNITVIWIGEQQG